MTSYGFRLFRATIHRNNRGDPLSVEIGDGDEKQHFRDYLFELADSRKGAVVHGSPPRVAEEAEEPDEDPGEEQEPDEGQRARSRPVLVVDDVTLRGEHLVVDYYYGRHLGYAFAGYSEEAAVDQPPIPIADLKSVRPYRATFIFPNIGELGVVAVEDANRTHASKKLEQWLRAWAREDGTVEAKKKREETGKKNIRPLWWSMRLTPMSDPERLRKLIKDGTSSKIVLTKMGGSNTNTPGKSPLRVEMGLDDGSSASKARNLISRWSEFFNGPQTAKGEAQNEAARDLAAVLADKYSGFDDESYDDAYIEVKDTDGKKKKISPSRWADIFIYPVSNGADCPSRSVFFGRVQKAVSQLEKSLEIAIDWVGWGVENG